MKSIREIEVVRGRCVDSVCDTGSSRYPGMSYEDGVEEALAWVLGQEEQSEWPYVAESEES